MPSELLANDAVTYLNGAIDASQTTITVANTTGFPTTGNFRIRIDNEIMLVTGVSGNTWTVTRAAEKVRGIQIAAAHLDKSRVPHLFTAASVPLVGGGGGPSFDAAANLFIGGGGTLIVPDGAGDSGCDNIGIGGQSFDTGDTDVTLKAITGGVGNIGIGSSCLTKITNAFYNVAIGDAVLNQLVTGNGNIAIADSALFSLVTGSDNVDFGGGLQTLSSGNRNANVGTIIIHSTSGDNNVFINGGGALVTGGDNTFIGTFSNTTKTSLSHGIAIGRTAIVTNDNQCVIGGNANQTDPLSNPGVPVCLIWSGATAPADADLVASQGSAYWTFTPSSCALKLKGKDSSGTVFNQTLAGINVTNTWTATQTINLNAASAPTASTGTGLQIVGTDATVARVEADAFGAIAAFTARRADGTGASPTALQSGDQIGAFNFQGYYVTGGPGYSGTQANLAGYASQNWTSANQGTKVVIRTTPNNSTTLTDALTINNDGSVVAAGAISASNLSGSNTGDQTAGAGITLSGGAFSLDLTHANTWTGVQTFAPTARTSGSAAALTITGPADTNSTLSTERIAVNVDLSATVQFATGALTTQRAMVVNAPTYSAVGASTITTAATLAISGAPVAGTNATLTNKWALWVQAGDALFAGNVRTSAGISINTLAIQVGTANNGFLAPSGTTLYMSCGATVIYQGNGSTGQLTIPSTGSIGWGTSGITGNDAIMTRTNSGVGVSSAVRTTGSPSCLTVTTPADTTLTASTESISVNFNCSASRQFSTGALTTQRECVFQAPTYTFVGASTITSAATLAITNAPQAGTNATLTNAYALWVQAGAVRFDGTKAGFFGVAPVVKPATTGTGATGYTQNASANAVVAESTFTGNSGSTAYTISDVVLALKQLGFLTA